MNFKKQQFYLFVAGLTLFIIGAYIAFTPSQYLGQFNIAQEVNIEIMSELRGMGGSLFVFGLFVFSGAFIKHIEKTAMSVSALIFISFSVFRSIGIMLDGVPSQSILIALFVEGLFAVFVIALLFSNKVVKAADQHTLKRS